jgi:hypothetical protein
MKTTLILAFAAVAQLGVFASGGSAQTMYYPNTIYSPQAIEAPQNAAASPVSLPSDAREIVAAYEAQKSEVEKRAARQVRELRQRHAAKLKELQDRYTREAKLDEAVAIRDTIRALREQVENVQADPGALYAYNNSVGRTFYFRVTGNNQRTVWGSDIYTTDSGLAAAAVHAGAVKLGQTAVIKVTILPGQAAYGGSARNGIATSPWNNFPASFKVQSVEDEDLEAPAEEKRAEPAKRTPSPRGDEPLTHRMEEYREDLSRLQRQLREVSTQIKEVREEVESLKKAERR